jgi:hypothetical protein
MMTCLFKKTLIISYGVAASMLICILGAWTDTTKGSNSMKSGLIWGKITNEFCVGVDWETAPIGKGFSQEVRILVKTSITNGILGYLLLPNHKLAKAELRDANGVVLVPLKGKKIDGELPQEIQSKDLPHHPARPRHLTSLKNLLFLSPSIPEVFWNFSMQDIYRIEKEGDYTFTIVVAIYHLTSDGQSAVRMDLSPVTVHLHLTASQQ